MHRGTFDEMTKAGSRLRPVYSNVPLKSHLLEIARFLVSGLLGTIVNLTILAATSYYFSYQTALVLGLVAGFIASFFLSKFFTFRAKSWTKYRRELMVFTMIYALGAIMCWWVAIVSRHLIFSRLLHHPLDNLAGGFVGASTMAASSYVGHRFLTFRSK